MTLRVLFTLAIVFGGFVCATVGARAGGGDGPRNLAALERRTEEANQALSAATSAGMSS